MSNNSNEDVASSELNRNIRTEVQQLSERWSTLLHRSELWQRRLDNGLPVRIQQDWTVVQTKSTKIRLVAEKASC